MSKILIVDDEEDSRKLLRQTLEEAGYEVLEADNVEAGLQTLRSAAVDLILTDILMPDKSGLEFIQEIQDHFAGVKIVAISGGFIRSAHKEATLAEALKIESTLAKPYSVKELLQTVSEVLAE